MSTWHCIARTCGERHEVVASSRGWSAATDVMQHHADTVHAHETRWPCTFVITHPNGSTSVTYATPTRKDT